MSPTRLDILSRLVIAKILYTRGAGACEATNDKQSFAIGILQLQDSVELALGALGDQVGASLPDPIRFHEYFDRIDERIVPEKLPYRRELLGLNSVRVSLKHRGYLPDVSACRHFPSVVLEFLVGVCDKYFALDFSLVSLRDAIREENARRLLVAAEEKIEQGDIQGALEFMAIAWYRGFERKYSVGLGLGRLLGAPKDVVFPETDYVNLRLDLIEKGIDPFLYFRFKNLAPKIGERTADGELVTEWELDYGHPKNWTGQNARFCFDFVVDALIKVQAEPDATYTLVHYNAVYIDKIEPTGEEAVFYEKGYPPSVADAVSFKTASPLLVSGKPLGEIALRLRRGEYCLGWAHREDEVLYSVVLAENKVRFLRVEISAIRLTSMPRELAVEMADGTVRLRSE
jgi:hypothetical protein